MTQMLFYENLAAVDAARHEKTRLAPMQGFAYAKGVNSVPIVAAEFGEAHKEYPIVLAKTADEGFVPVVVLGLRDHENLFVDGEGKWDARYVPAFVRRYPFVPADVGEGQSVLCIDESAPCLGENEGEPLFVDGKPGALVQNAVALLQDYQANAMQTAQLMKQFAEADLLVENQAQIAMADGAKFSLSGMYVLDEKRLQALPADQAQELLASGALGFAYAHLLSLSNLQRLTDRLALRRAS